MKSVGIINKIKGKSWSDWEMLFKNKYKDVKYAFSSRSDKAVLCIIGCQRSGSTMMYEIFRKDPRAKVYSEFCSLNSDDKAFGIRLNAVEKVKPILTKLGHPLVVLKPLVESQDVNKLLALHKNAKCVWLFRDFRDVAASNIKKWGPQNGINNLRPIIKGETSNWRSEKLPEEVVAMVNTHFSEEMPSHDAAALFWWVRNSLYFSQKLQENDRIFTCNYKNLVSEPHKKMAQIYQFINVDYPSSSITSHVHTNSVKKGNQIEISKPIESLCQTLYDELCKYENYEK